MHTCTLPSSPEQNRTPKAFYDALSLGTVHTCVPKGWNLQGTGGEGKECPSQGIGPHLLTILMLQVQPCLDVTSGLLKGLALRHFSRVVCADTDGIGAEEEHHVSTKLWEGGRGG